MMRGAGKSDRPVVPEEPANEDGSCLGRRGSGEACTGTPAETPETGKCEPDATPGGSNRAVEQVTAPAPLARRFEGPAPPIAAATAAVVKTTACAGLRPRRSAGAVSCFSVRKVPPGGGGAGGRAGCLIANRPRR